MRLVDNVRIFSETVYGFADIHSVPGNFSFRHRFACIVLQRLTERHKDFNGFLCRFPVQDFDDVRHGLLMTSGWKAGDMI